MISTTASALPAQWDMQLTRETVGTLFGRQQLDLLAPVVRSVRVRLLHALIHYTDYCKLFDLHFTNHIADGFKPIELLFGGNGEDGVGANNSFFIRAEAHVYAGLQALHAVADNMAHVVYYSLGWNLESKPSLASTGFYTIKERLINDAAVAPELRGLRDVFVILCGDGDFKALENATNHLKHHGGLPIEVGLNDDDGAPLIGKLKSFRRKLDLKPAEAVVNRLEQSQVVMNRFVVEAGCSLNEILMHRR